MARALQRLARWLSPKSVPAGLRAEPRFGFLDSYRRLREPSPVELLAELKNTAWTCAAINAAVCASFPPRLYVTTAAGQAAPKCLTKALPARSAERLRAVPHLAGFTAKAARIEEVLAHPLLHLFRQVNPEHNSWDLWELTTLYQETIGSAYWLLAFNALGVPVEIWPLPAQHVSSRREQGSPNLVDCYEVRGSAEPARYRPEEIVHFRYPDPKDPYGGGLKRSCISATPTRKIPTAAASPRCGPPRSRCS